MVLPRQSPNSSAEKGDMASTRALGVPHEEANIQTATR